MNPSWLASRSRNSKTSWRDFETDVETVTGCTSRILDKDAREALPTALTESVPAIAASGGTVIAAMLVRLVADLQSTHWLGPILAIGIAVMPAAAFTLLPALLSLLGEHAFWPATKSANGSASRGSFGTHTVPKEPRDIWGRVAALVRRHG